MACCGGFLSRLGARESLLFLVLAGAGSAQAQGLGAVPTEAAILARVEQARADNRANLRPYTVKRTYRLFGQENQIAKSEVIANVTFVPPDVKQYAIQHANGTGLGEKIVRQMLEHEMDVAKNYAATEISRANYDFRFIGEEDVGGERSYVLDLLPRRNDNNLLRGKIWVDTTTFLLHRTEGQPAKASSWWLRDVRIALAYGYVGGMWLQTSSVSTANVRLLGQHTMVSRDLEYEFSELSALRGTR